MAAKKKTGPKSGSAKPKRATKPPKAPQGEGDSAAPQQANQPTADQMVLALANAVVGVLSGQNAQIALNALAAATARICLSTKTKSVDFSRLLTAQVEVQACLMLEEARAQRALEGEIESEIASARAVLNKGLQ